MARPKLKEVAELASVSEPTVSRVLNGRAGVAEKTRARVISALETLGFDDVPEPGMQRRGVVGVVTGELSNPVFPTMVDSISNTLSRLGLLSTVSMSDAQLSTEERCIAEFVETAVDGVVFIGGSHAVVDGDLSRYERLVSAGIPIVLVNGRRTELDAPHVFCDEQIGATKAVEHLLDLGHTRIGCVLGSSDYIPTKRMAAGFEAALDRGGLTPGSDSIIHTAFTFEGGRAGSTRMVERGYTGLVMSNDLMALGSISAAQTMGVEVPNELSIVGYDGTAITALTSPPLTTLRQPFDEMTKLIADALVSELDGTRRLRDTYVFEPELLSRGSSGRHVDARQRRSTDF